MTGKRYDFGKIFDKFDVNPKDGKLDEKEAAAAMKAGYFAAAGMEKSIFETLNLSNSRSKETYDKELLGEILDKTNKTSAETDSLLNEIIKKIQE